MKKSFALGDKVWAIEIEGNNISTFYGNAYDYQLRTSKKELADEQKCLKEAEKLIKSKTKKGYEELAVFIEGEPYHILIKVDECLKGKEKSLDIRGEKLSPKLIDIIWTLDGLESLRLHLDGDVPKEISKLTSLKRLDISFKGALTDSIGELQNLEKLELYNEEKDTFCTGISKLINLKELSFNADKLKEIPSYIGDLKALELLKTSGSLGGYYDENYNQIIKPLGIPKEIGQLEQLRELEITACDLSELPDEIGDLKSLKELRLDYNIFKEVPQCICKLSNLEELDLTGVTTLVKIPYEFCQMTSLEDFDFEYDRVQNIPEDVSYQGVKAIQEYLRENNVGEPKDTSVHEEEPKKVEKLVQELMSVPPENKDKLIKKSKERYNEILPGIKKWIYGSNLEVLEKVIQFVKGESDEIVESNIKDASEFENLPYLLSPINEWNFMDDRLLKFMSKAFYFMKDKYAYGYHEKMMTGWFLPQLKKEKEGEDLFGFVAQKLKEVGINEKQFLTAYLDEVSSESFVREDGSINSVGKSLQKYLENDPEQAFELYDEHYNIKYLIPILLNSEKGLLEKFTPKITEIRKYKGYDGNKHIAISVLHELCKVNPSPYEQIILDKIEETDCISCAMEAHTILLSNFGDKYREETVKKAKETVKYISDKCNDDSGYLFNWTSSSNRFGDNTAEFFQWVSENLKEELRDDLMNYVVDTKRLSIDVVTVLVNSYEQEAITAAIESLKMTDKGRGAAAHFRQAFSLLEMLDFSQYYDEVWKVACSSHHEVSSHAILALSSCSLDDVLPKAKELLKSKKSEERMAAVSVLCQFKFEETGDLLLPLLETEKKDEVRNVIVNMTYKPENIEEITIEEMRRRVSSAVERKKLDKPPVKFLDALPKIKWKNGDLVNKEELYFIFYRQKCANEIEPEAEVAPVYHLIAPSSVTVFITKLMDQITYTAKDKLFFAFIGKLGSKTIIPELENKAYKSQNVHVCTILGMMGTMNAASALDRIMKHYDVKYPNVRFAAVEAFENIADALGLTYFELKDKMLPDFGFENHEKTLEVENVEYKMVINTDQKFEFIDPKGKVKKSLSKAKRELKEEIKSATKLLKTVNKQFKSSIELYLVTQRFWSLEDWSKFFLDHPLAFSVCKTLVWIKNEIDTFVVNSSGEFRDKEGNKLELKEDDEIKIVHPLNLSSQVLSYWNEYLSDEKLTPVIDQLNREVLSYEREHGKIMCKLFEDKKMEGGTFKYRARKQGWKRGSIGDGGGVNTYRKEFIKDGIEVFIETENLNVQADLNDEEMTLGKLYFTQIGTVKLDSFFYQEPRNMNDERFVKLEDVHKIVYSESMKDLREIVSREENE